MQPELQTRPVIRPLSAEPLARGIVDFLGGPTGRFGAVGRQRWWTPLRVLISVALVFLSFGFLSKARCLEGATGEDGSIGLNWSGNRQYVAACYNDITPLYEGRGLHLGGFPYAYSWVEGDVTRYLEYPVLAGYFQWLMAAFTRLTYPLVEASGLVIPEASWYFAFNALVMSVLWVLMIRMVADLAGHRIWDTLLVAASPLVIVHAFTNWDIPSITFAVAAIWCAAKGRFGWAGLMIGLGTAFKLWPLYLLGAYLVLAIRDRKFVPFLTMIFVAAASWLALNLPVLLAYPEGWNEFLRLNSERGYEWTTIYAIIDRNTILPAMPVALLNVVSFVLFAVACVAILILGLTAPRRPRAVELIFLIIVAFLIFNKVWSPQYSLWLVVPAVLALPRWRLLFAWMTVDALVWPLLMWHMLGAENKGIPSELLDVALLARLAILTVMVVLVVRQMLTPERRMVET
ncbi:MAG: glycosyltransferase 87 family protein [Corynebacterium sp.]|uniref:glycosyltransferase family 87 protein n=1 Tax=Corynebacterium sp. TaxID=1720 RepID=UPI0026DEFD1E|nr:glycosyltransferase 87 family protein [Corynebacterium sp.]MDO5670736.1 glycosyltransferase 87 family protein [Corynebacterium sp.]